MKTNILIAGGTGFIGRHLCKKCTEKKWKVYSISTKLPTKEKKVNGVKYLVCNLYDKKKLKRIIKKKKFDYVVNLGGHVNHENKKKVLNSHYLGCKNLAEIFFEV